MQFSVFDIYYFQINHFSYKKKPKIFWYNNFKVIYFAILIAITIDISKFLGF